jgi:hypothetical protein
MRWPFIPDVVLFCVIDAYARSILSHCAGRDATAAIGVVALIMQQLSCRSEQKRARNHLVQANCRHFSARFQRKDKNLAGINTI